jgi:ATP-dependent phosphofructokinase / diphosphate-dependent phosphofructokinase
MAKTIGILTAGGDSPGLNAAIRAIGKAAIRSHGMQVVGFRDGFRGLMQNRTIRLDGAALSGILTHGGTILGTSRDKPHKMKVGDRTLDMTDTMIENCVQNGIDTLICLGGGGTQKNALRLANAGLRIITLPKTIDNDVWGTDRTFGFDTALGIATEAIDRLHSTAHSHHRIMVVEVMGHNTGWLALGSGLAGGADVIAIPEIPYKLDALAETISQRRSSGSTFSIVAVSEGAVSAEHHADVEALESRLALAEGDERTTLKAQRKALEADEDQSTPTLARELEERTGLEARVTILGHVQRGGTPSTIDRLLASSLGTEAAHAAAQGLSGIMIASRGSEVTHVPLEEVAGRRKTVPLDHPWIRSALRLGVGFGN